MNADSFYAYGRLELSVWKVALDILWLQTTTPRYSRKLNQRQDTRRVAVTDVNRYRRTYEMRGSWRKVKGIAPRFSDGLHNGTRELSSQKWLTASIERSRRKQGARDHAKMVEQQATIP